VDPGFDPKNVLTFELSLPREGFADRQAVAGFYQRTLERITALPGVTAAGAATILPLSGSNTDESFVIEGRVPQSIDDVNDVEYRVVTPDYFRALAIPIISGRAFASADSDKSIPVAIVNEAVARRYFPGEDPIGKRVTTDDPRESRAVWLTIIGVAGDVKHRGLAEQPEPEMYVAHQQYPSRGMSFAIRSGVSPDKIASTVAGEIAGLDPKLPIYNVRTMDRLVSESIAQQRLSTVLFGIFAAIALVLASIGIYGVVSYNVAERGHEIAIRRALGAQRSEILRIVIGQGLMLVLSGGGIGLVLALVLARGLSGLLFDVSRFDVATYLFVPLLLSAVALLAIYLPARRAAAVDPVSALK